MTRIGWIVMSAGIAAVSSGCAEKTLFKTYPPGANVTVNGRSVGTSPVVVRVPRSEFSGDGVFRYHVEREGYRPTDGEFMSIPAPGRVVAGVFTLGIFSLFRGGTTLPEGVDVVLEPLNGPAGHPPKDDTARRLRRLEDLHDQGSIDEDEYRRERAKILRGL
jgi:hypothetical protein